jgi:hypothetical protein
MKCSHCPLATACPGENHRPICWRFDPASEHYNPGAWLPALTASGAALSEAGQAVQSAQAAPAADPGHDLALLRLAETCLYRGEKASGGCNCIFKCHANRGGNPLHPFTTTKQECLACLKSAYGPGV